MTIVQGDEEDRVVRWNAGCGTLEHSMAQGRVRAQVPGC